MTTIPTRSSSTCAVEFETLFFFLGILLLVGMLKEIRVLDGLVHIYDRCRR